MKIQKKRIRNPERYLIPFSPGDGLYITAPLPPENSRIVNRYDINLLGAAFIPRPVRSATTLNSNGRWIIDKTVPKEPREIEHDYHIVDWHGNDHYGTCWQTRMCYHREFVPPTEISFRVENGVIFSPQFFYNEKDIGRIKIAINVLLEIFGFCELWTVQKSPAIPPFQQETVPWEILRAGNGKKADWEAYLQEMTRNKSQEQKTIIARRHEHLWQLDPDFLVLGKENFWGYIVYGFSAKNLFVFECNQPDNATYFFRGSWEAVSKLTKTEVLAGNLQEARLFHTESWYNRTHSMLT